MQRAAERSIPSGVRLGHGATPHGRLTASKKLGTGQLFRELAKKERARTGGLRGGLTGPYQSLG